MSGVRSNRDIDSSEDGSSSLEPQPSAPPLDEQKDPGTYKMESDKRVQHATHRYSSFADAVVNGHARPVSTSESAAQPTKDRADIDHASESSSALQDPRLQLIASRHYEGATQPLSKNRTLEGGRRANTPSGIMSEMSLGEKESHSTKHNGCLNNIGCNVSHKKGDRGLMGSISTQTTTQMTEREVETCTEEEDRVEPSGVGALLSEYNSPHTKQEEHQQVNLGHITKYYSMASQCSLPIHTPTAVASDNERLRKLSNDFFRSPEHTFERLSYILGRGRLVMVRYFLGASESKLSDIPAKCFICSTVISPSLS